MPKTTLKTEDNRLVAPLSHTGLLLTIILALTLFGFYSQRHSLTESAPQTPGSKLILYLSIIALQYGLLRLIVVGLRRRGHTLSSLIGGKDSRPRTLVLDLIIGVTVWAILAAIGTLVKKWLGGVNNHSAGLLPNGLAERLLWLLVSAAAGFVEEICYRGYLQRQMWILTGSAAIGVVLQAILFAISHSYQGMKSVLVIFAYGTILGLVAFWRQSLRPGIITHALTDIVGGLYR